MVSAYAMPGNAGRKGNAETGADKFADRHGTVTFEDHMGHEPCHTAVEIGDGTKAGSGLEGDEARFFEFVEVDRRLPGVGIRIRHGQHDVFLQESHGVVVFNGVDGGGQEKVHMILSALAGL